MAADQMVVVKVMKVLVLLVNICAGGCGDIDYTLGVTDAYVGDEDVRSAVVMEDVGSAGDDGYVQSTYIVSNYGGGNGLADN
jgi:hypothetical protein